MFFVAGNILRAAIFHIAGILDEQGIVGSYVVMSCKVFGGIFFHQVIHAPILAVQKDLAGSILLNGRIAVFHQGKEKDLLQLTAGVQYQIRIGNARIKENR